MASVFQAEQEAVIAWSSLHHSASHFSLLQVFLDGVDIRQLNLEWLRGQLSLVSQEPHLFTGTIRENIAYGKPDAVEEEIREAAASANALDFILASPLGLDTKASFCLVLSA